MDFHRLAEQVEQVEQMLRRARRAAGSRDGEPLDAGPVNVVVRINTPTGVSAWAGPDAPADGPLDEPGEPRPGHAHGEGTCP
jgi:hypothetical protein